MRNQHLIDLNVLLLKYNENYKKGLWDEKFKKYLLENINYHSNKMEGMTINYYQTIAFLKEGFLPTNFQESDLRKVKDMIMLESYRNVLKEIFSIYNSFQFSETSIKYLHKEIIKDEYALKPSDIYNAEPGEYKNSSMGTFRNMNGKSVFHSYPEPHISEKLLRNLITETNILLSKMNILSDDYHPIKVAGDFHYIFLNEIHPFEDGNGRLCRILTNIILMKGGIPPVIIKAEGENRTKYMDVFLLCETQKSMEPMLIYLIGEIKSTLQTGIERKFS